MSTTAKVRLTGVNRLTRREAVDLMHLLDSWVANVEKVPATIRRARDKIGLAILAAEQREREAKGPVPAVLAPTRFTSETGRLAQEIRAGLR